MPYVFVNSNLIVNKAPNSALNRQFQTWYPSRMKGVNRREFITAAAATTLNIISGSADSRDSIYRFLESPLSIKTLEQHKLRAIQSLVSSIPPLKETEYLRSYSRLLPLESQMYIPHLRELEDVVKKSLPQLEILAEHIPLDGYGLFAFADVTHEKKRVHRLYVLRRNSPKDIQFVKGYRISMARKGFGNESDSEQTPLGLHFIESGTQGMFGEVVSQLNRFKESFTHVKYRGKDHWFVKGFGREASNDVAEVVTDQYLLVGPNTNASRGIRIHGSNRSGEIDESGRWTSFLDGKMRSTACLRLGQTDIRDLSILGFVRNGTAVMIHATEDARKYVAPIVPPRWIPPEEQQTDYGPKKNKAPEKWIPPQK